MVERVFKWQEELADSGKKPPSLTDRAYDRIRARIIDRSLEPGHDFTEAMLATSLAMSKTPVREALARLQMEGFVQAIPRRGYMVTPIHMSSIKDLFAFRALIDGEAAALAAGRAQHAFIEELETLIEVGAEDSRSTEPDARQITRMNRIDNAFHEVVVLASGNRRLHRCAVGVLREFERFYHLEASHPEFYGSDFVGHAEVCAAIKRGEPEAARMTMKAHIESSRRVLIKGMTEGPSAATTTSAWL